MGSIERALLDEIFRHTPASMAIWRGPDLKLEHVNPGYVALFPGRPLLGLRPLEAFPELADQEIPDYLYRVYETGVPHVGQESLVRHRRREGGPIEERYYDFAYLRIHGPGGKPYGVYDFAMDVTARVHARQALVESNSKLEVEREMRDRFVALLTHDLRTPLNVARMNLHLAIQKAGHPQDMVAHASKAIDAIARIDTMVRNLLDTSRIEAGVGLEIHVSHCELVSLVTNTCGELTALYGANFLIRAPDRIDGYWSCADLQRAIENLGSNAAKYGDTAQPITVVIAPIGNEVEITIHNAGRPIPPEDLPILFDSFKRSSSAGSVRGWGLGLSLVRGVADAHGGSVSVESSEASGTMFTLRLPIDCR